MSETRNLDYLHTSDENYAPILAIFKLKITISFKYLQDYYTKEMIKYLSKFVPTVLQ